MTGTPLLRRTFDIIAVLVSLPVVVPVALAVALLIRMTSKGPVLYRAARVGRGGTPFIMYKFRTMTPATDGPLITGDNDLRITRIGRRLRRMKLDELPQLYNVLRGEMTLVGPRPEEPRFLNHYTEDERRLLSVPPGITGAATVAYRDEERLLAATSPDEVEARYVAYVLHQKLAIDVAYLERRSLRGDVGILLRTLSDSVCALGFIAAFDRLASVTRDLVSNIGYSAVGQALPMITNFALAPYLIAHLGIDRFGVWSLIVILIATFSAFDGGVGASLARFYALVGARHDREAAGRLLVGSLLVFLALGVVVSSAALALAPTAVVLLRVPASLHSEAVGVLRPLGPLVALALVSNSATSLLQANARFRALAGATFLSCVGYGLGAVIVVGHGQSLEALVAVSAGRYLILLVAGFWLAREHFVLRRPLLPDRPLMREFRSYAVRMQLAGLTYFLNGQIDAFVVAALLPIRYVGIYAVGYQAASAVRSVPLYAFPPILTRITRSFAGDGMSGARRAFDYFQSRWLRAVLTYGVLAATAMTFCIRSWVGPQFTLSGVVAAVLVIGYSAHVALTGIRTCFVRSIGRPGLETRYSWMSTVLNTLLTVPLVWLFGVVGVVAGTATGLLGGSVYLVVLCRREFGLRELRPGGRWLVATVAGAVVTVLGELAVTRLGWQGVLPLLLTALPLLTGLVVAAAVGLRGDVRVHPATQPVGLDASPTPEFRGVGGPACPTV